ncbi:MAG: flagellin [Lachnospiraceae bacterium]|nr:flagellin [Lachnospiraceae bacterium]MBQ9234168.1 flagellin [Lachnospiraceae bacterium]
MVVQHNMQAVNTNRMLAGNVKAVSKSTEKLSSGYAVNRAADDAAGLSISEKMRNQIRGINQAVKNSEDGVSLIQTAEGNMNEIHSILQRMGELATKAANDVNATEDRTAIQNEIDQLTTEIDSISNKAAFNGTKLLNGDFKSKNLQVGAVAGENMNITISTMNATLLSVKSLDMASHGSASDAMSKISAAIKTVSAARSELGAKQNRLDYTINNLNNYSENLTSAESQIRDTDMAAEMTSYTKNNILQQAAQSMLAQANQSTQGVLSLLG